MPRRIPLSEPIPSMPYPSPTARSRLTFELSRQTGLRRKPKGNISPCIIAVPRWAGDSKRGDRRDAERTLVFNSSKEGQTVLDPFMGSGTTAIACIKERRHFIGFELSKEYFDKANKRIKLEQQQLSLF